MNVDKIRDEMMLPFKQSDVKDLVEEGSASAFIVAVKNLVDKGELNWSEQEVTAAENCAKITEQEEVKGKYG